MLVRFLHVEHNLKNATALIRSFYNNLLDPFDQDLYILFLIGIKSLEKEDQENLLKLISKQPYKEMLN